MSSTPFTAPRWMILASVLLSVVAGCGHEQVRRGPENRAATHVETGRGHLTRGEQAAVSASRQVGVPYRYGGNNVRGFDCSGLVQFAWSEAGVRIPRTTAEQWRRMSPVGKQDLRIGDLLFFRIDGRVSHVGMYLGNGRFVHAPSTGRNVSVASLNSSFYRQTFAGATRP